MAKIYQHTAYIWRTKPFNNETQQRVYVLFRPMLYHWVNFDGHFCYHQDSPKYSAVLHQCDRTHEGNSLLSVNRP